MTNPQIINFLKQFFKKKLSSKGGEQLNRRILGIASVIAVMIPIASYLVTFRVYRIDDIRDISPVMTKRVDDSGVDVTRTPRRDAKPHVGRNPHQTPDVDSSKADNVLPEVSEVSGVSSDVSNDNRNGDVSEAHFNDEYPEVPPDYPWPVPWLHGTRFKKGSAEYDDYVTLHKVLIKLWKQGERFDGGSTMNGKVYPEYPNVIYVRWSEYFDEITGEGGRWYASVLMGPRIQEVPRGEFGHFWFSDVEQLPADIELRDISEGIEPQTFFTEGD